MDLKGAILALLINRPNLSSTEIHDLLDGNASYSTTKRMLTNLINKKLIEKTGNGKGTKYRMSKSYDLLHSIDVEAYFEVEIDQRQIRETFNFQLIGEDLLQVDLFTDIELEELENLQSTYQENIAGLTPEEYNKEVERLALDLSWKSSQIEGNTYTLLETERLLREKRTASGRLKDEAVMLLNHKDAIDFIIENPDYLLQLSVKAIKDIHHLLTKELGITRNIRNRRVGINGHQL